MAAPVVHKLVSSCAEFAFLRLSLSAAAHRSISSRAAQGQTSPEEPSLLTAPSYCHMINFKNFKGFIFLMSARGPSRGRAWPPLHASHASAPPRRYFTPPAASASIPHAHMIEMDYIVVCFALHMLPALHCLQTHSMPMPWNTLYQHGKRTSCGTMSWLQGSAMTLYMTLALP